MDTTSSSQRKDYYDVGAQQKLFGRRLPLGVDGYYRSSTHLIDEVSLGPRIILTPFNYATGHITGVELTGSFVDAPSAGVFGGITKTF